VPVSDETPLGSLVEHRSAVMRESLICRARDQRLDAVLSKTVLLSVFVTRQSLWSLALPPQSLQDDDLIHNRLDAFRYVRLPSDHFDRQWHATTATEHEEPAAKSASRADKSLFFRLFRMARTSTSTAMSGLTRPLATGPRRRSIQRADATRVFALKFPLRQTQNQGISNGTQPVIRLVASRDA